MFPFFQRKPSTNTDQTATPNPFDPLPHAILATALIAEHKLDSSLGWSKKAHEALMAGDLHKHNSLLVLAMNTAQEAIALMESADLLHEEILNLGE